MRKYIHIYTKSTDYVLEKKNMVERAILLTIKKNHAENIFVWKKTMEYRNRPPRISKPTRTILYVSGDQEIVGECTLMPVHGARTPLGYPLSVSNPIQYQQPLQWKAIRQEIPRIRRPHQNFRYIDPENDADSRLLEILERE